MLPKITIEGLTLPEPSFWRELLELEEDTVAACGAALREMPRERLTDLLVARDADELAEALEQADVDSSAARVATAGLMFLAEGMAAEAWDREPVVQYLKATGLVEQEEPPVAVQELLGVIEGVKEELRGELRMRARLARLMPTFSSIRVAYDLRDIEQAQEGDVQPEELVQRMVPVGIIRIADNEREEPFVFQVHLEDVQKILDSLQKLGQALETLEAWRQGRKGADESGG